ncbi:hypothetical protein EJ06DRAFT_556521 [Trichodelitschia bisporula]|uniref:Uncharacterized protein n=1 Tax=Trichodelitschia bisporula TaxID=703511 RepID=A0A6G1HW51_9PEZI|nr:hypothetical protein EJ06DRAFT_556521 [Trichodelitschia bisporula]
MDSSKESSGLGDGRKGQTTVLQWMRELEQQLSEQGQPLSHLTAKLAEAGSQLRDLKAKSCADAQHKAEIKEKDESHRRKFQQQCEDAAHWFSKELTFAQRCTHSYRKKYLDLLHDLDNSQQEVYKLQDTNEQLRKSNEMLKRGFVAIH